MPRKRLAGVLIAAFAGVALAALTGLAIAKTFTLSMVKSGTVTNTKGVTTHEPIAVDSHGSAVYDLIPETIHRALCTKGNGCWGFWFPVKVSSAHAKLSAAPGVKGKLGTWHHSGIYQLTLGGHPLYTFKGDGSKKGVGTGEGIKGFRGTWHVIKAEGSSNTMSATTTTTTTTSNSTTTTSTYTYPSY